LGITQLNPGPLGVKGKYPLPGVTKAGPLRGRLFTNNVEIEVDKTRQGLKISRLETQVLDKQEKRLKVLAMLLVDVDYNGESFDMDRTVFAKDIDESGDV